jgi:sialate O-acetylesterase
MTRETILVRCARTLFSSLTILCLLAMAGAAAAADLRLASSDQGRLAAPILSDHMVLQRGQAVPIWGEGLDGTKVEVELRDPTTGRLVAEASTVVVAESWRVDLAPLETGGPYDLRVSDSRGQTREVVDILVGEVWFAVGQSNLAPGRFPADASWNLDFADPAGPVDGSWVRAFSNGNERNGVGWQSRPGDTAGWLATGLAESLALQEGAPVPVGIVNLAVPGAAIRRWAGSGSGDRSVLSEGVGDYYKSWLLPCLPYASRGVFWWQGESDHQGSGAPQYAERFRRLIEDWRTDFENDELFFAAVMLPNGKGVAIDELVRGYPRSRPPEARSAGLMYDAYLSTSRETPLVGLALTKDLPGGTHPSDREVYAQRLVDVARHDVYGESFAYSGPVFDCMERVGDTLRIHFKGDTGLGLRAGGVLRKAIPATALQGVQIGTDAEARVWANTRIDGEVLEVFHPTIRNPAYLNYAWRVNPRWANLFNEAGLAAGPFAASWPRDACAN